MATTLLPGDMISISISGKLDSMIALQRILWEAVSKIIVAKKDLSTVLIIRNSQELQGYLNNQLKQKINSQQNSSKFYQHPPTSNIPTPMYLHKLPTTTVASISNPSNPTPMHHCQKTHNLPPQNP
jgi:hypothetical protein